MYLTTKTAVYYGGPDTIQFMHKRDFVKRE